MDFPPNTLFKCAIKGSQHGGSAYVNVHHWWMYSENQVSDALVETALTAHLQELFYAVRDSLPGNVRWDEAEVQYFDGSYWPGWVNWKTITLGFTGNDTSDPLPAGVSATVTGTTSRAKVRGRKFLPPLGETYQDDQLWTATGLVRLAGYALEWVTGKVVGSSLGWLYPVVMLTSEVFMEWAQIRSTRVNATPGYQRRRKPGSGA